MSKANKTKQKLSVIDILTGLKKFMKSTSYTGSLSKVTKAIYTFWGQERFQSSLVGVVSLNSFWIGRFYVRMWHLKL